MTDLNALVKLHQANRLDEALTGYLAVSRASPDYVQARRLAGVVALQRGQHAVALGYFDEALAVRADAADVLVNRAAVYRQLGRLTEARDDLQTAVSTQPAMSEAHNALGSVLMAQQNVVEALAAFRRAVELSPNALPPRLNLAGLLLQLNDAQAALSITTDLTTANHPAAWKLHGLALAGIQDSAAAAQWLQKAAQAQGEPDVWYRLAGVLEDLGRWDEALEAVGNSLKLQADFVPSLSSGCFLARRLVRWDLLEKWRPRLMAALGRPGVQPFALLAEPVSAADQLRCARAWAASIARTDTPPASPGTGTPLRVGFVSNGLGRHPTGSLLVEMVERLPRDGFQWIAYATAPSDRSPLRLRLEQAFDQLRECAGDSPAQIVEAIRADGIDVLFDLRGYGGGAVTEVFAARAVPLQVNWLAYPGTMGTDFIDVIFADRIVIPDELRPQFDEDVVYLQSCYQPNDTTRNLDGAGITRAAAGLPEAGPVFCSFNNSYKISPDTFRCWMQILRQTEGSVLWLLEPKKETTVAANLRRHAVAAGVDAERIVFMAKKPQAEYLAHYALADLFLDTWPYNAHTTASDALWAGCPVLTLQGETFAGRVASSIVSAAGLDDFIVHSEQEYVERAVHLATDSNALAKARRKLAKKRELPLFDMQAFAEDFARKTRDVFMARCKQGAQSS